jgi:HD-GYP domain-containing protein (c-di-GMP phosphodiesterase class II)
MKKKNAESNTIHAIKETMSLSKHSNLLCKMPEYAGNIIDDILDSINNSDTALASLSSLKTYDKYTFSHSINVFLLSTMIGRILGLSRDRLLDLGMSSILHDIGKTTIPKGILNKKAKLSEREFAIIQTHASRGYFFAKENIPISDVSFLGILHHHEKYDGTGYPLGIRGEHIDIFGRIISIADVYDAMTSDRPYRKAQTHAEALEFIRCNSGNSFDPRLVDIFTNFIGAVDDLAYI